MGACCKIRLVEVLEGITVGPLPVVELQMELGPFSSLDAGAPEPNDRGCIGVTGVEVRGAGGYHTRGEITLETVSYVAVRIGLGPIDITCLV